MVFYSYSGSSDTASNLRPSSLRSPINAPIKLGYAEMFDQLCTKQVASFDIQEKFAEVLNAWFKPIPTCPDYLFYCPPGTKVWLKSYPSF